MPILTGETVKQVLSALYGYEIDDDDAQATANAVGAISAGARHLLTLGIDGIEAPFSYANMLDEADRLAREGLSDGAFA